MQDDLLKRINELAKKKESRDLQKKSKRSKRLSMRFISKTFVRISTSSLIR